ncbi:PREDICTED: probable L-gulonolactone oxidase 6 [Ipomoea nil]|uniref:probable L-gulonolactone oxidase 6 n=1 Tax=Ipomoea nil TaxID=35883 RepID=UPI0009018140|nr:PREDICTED: probable L-gulonolactone oxidase 6 [Ipomoea nil]
MAKMSINILITIYVQFLIFTVGSSLPEDPIKCTINNTMNCTITNSYGTFPDRGVCRAAKAVYPKTEAELLSIIAGATKQKRKMKAATRYSHSIPKLACPEGDDGLLISTKYLNRTLEVNASSMTMTVESGVSLRQVIEEAAKAGLALPYSPYWWGLTVGGLMGTGSHGSSLWGVGSSVHDHVIHIRIVTPATEKEGYATIRTLKQGNSDIKAARVSLGVLGVISQVTFKLQPMFKRSISFVVKNDRDLGKEATKFGFQHEFADMKWLPRDRHVVYRVDDRVSTNTSGNGLFDFFGLRAVGTDCLNALREKEEHQESIGDADEKCSNQWLINVWMVWFLSYGLTNDGVKFSGYPVIGYQNHMQSSGTCLDSLNDNLTCPWDPRVNGLFFHQTTFSISLTKVKSFIEDVQKLVDLEPKSLCVLGLYDGILMRYVKASTAYLGKQEDSIDFDITYYRSKDPMVPRLYEDILEEIEQMAMFKYGALPHWGKNRNVAFQGAIRKYKSAGEFLKVKKKFDPLGLFSSEWSDQILGLKTGLSIVKDGCALEGLCICSQDNHCAPNKGYFCRAGKVYKDAKVCVKIN